MKKIIFLALFCLFNLSAFSQIGNFLYTSNTINISCGNTPAASDVDLFYSVWLNWVVPGSCEADCAQGMKWKFELVDALNESTVYDSKIENVNQVNSSLYYEKTFQRPNKPGSFKIKIYKEGYVEKDDNGCLFLDYCQNYSYDFFNESSDLTFNYPNAGSATFTGEYVSVNNNFYEVCSGSDLTFQTNGCETFYTASIEELDANGNSYSPAQFVANPGKVYGSANNFDFNSIYSSFVNGGKYRLVLFRAFPSVVTEIFIEYNSTQLSYINLNQPNDFCEGDNVSITASGAGPLLWYRNGNLENTGPDLDFSSVSPNEAGTYTIESGASCVLPNEIDLVVNHAPEISFAGNPSTVCSNDLPFAPQMVVTEDGNPASGSGYWSGFCQSNGVYDPPNECSPSQNYSGNKSITYYHTTSAGCQESETFNFYYQLSPEVNLTVTNASCNGADDGSASINPVGGSGNIWSKVGSGVIATNTNSVNSLEPEDYIVTVYGSNGCNTSENFTVSEPAPLSVSYTPLTNAPCAHTSNHVGTGSIQITGGTSPYSISYDGGGFNTVTSNPFTRPDFAGDPIQVQINDVNTCTLTTPFVYEVQAEIDLFLEAEVITDATCVGVNNGSIELEADSDPTGSSFSFQWTGGQTSNNIYNLAANSNHTVTITESVNNCILVESYSIEETDPNSFDISFNPIQEPQCQGIEDGSITAVGVPTGNYSFNWNTGSNLTTLSNIPTGNYAVTMTKLTGQYAGCKQNETIQLNGSNPDYWQQRSNNLFQMPDNATAVIADDDDNVYVLGTFVGDTRFGPWQASSGSSEKASFYIVKYDACGNALWVTYGDYGTGNDFNVTPIDLILSGSEIYISMHFPNTNYPFFSIQTEPGSPTTAINSNNMRCQIFKLSALTGQIATNPSWTTDYYGFDDLNINTGDQAFDMEYHNGKFYIAGVDDDKASVYEVDFGNSYSLVMGSSTGKNRFTDIEFGTDIYAIGYTDQAITADFGNSITFTPASASQGFIVKFNGTFSATAAERTFGEQSDALGLVLYSNQPFITGNFTDATSDNAYIVHKSSGLIDQWVTTFDVNAPTTQWVDAVDIAYDASENKIIACGSFMGQSAIITDNGSGVNTAGSNSIASDIWVVGLNKSTGQADWLNSVINGGAGSIHATPTSIVSNSGGTSNYLVGNFGETLSFYQSQEPNLSHPNNIAESMFALRFGNVYSQNGPSQFYKKDESENEESKIEQTAFSLYPNPTKGTFNLTLPSSESAKNVIILDIGGRVISNQRINGESVFHEMDLSNSPSGTYFVEVHANSDIWRTKVVKF